MSHTQRSAGTLMVSDGEKRPRAAKPKGDRPEEFSPSGAPGDDPLTRNLKKVYAQVAAEPVPDRLLRLLDRLDGAARKDDNNG